VWQACFKARTDSSLISGASCSSLIGSSRIRSVLRYFLLSSGKTVTTADSSPSLFWIIRAPKKFAPDEMPIPNPDSAASFCVELSDASLVQELNYQKRRVADQAVQSADPIPCIVYQFNFPLTDLIIAQIELCSS
jgi:hypothetical protein